MQKFPLIDQHNIDALFSDVNHQKVQEYGASEECQALFDDRSQVQVAGRPE